MAEPLSIDVYFQPRQDGGLRAWCPQLPLFVLSNADPLAVLKDVVPVLEVMLSEKLDRTVKVTRVDLPDADDFDCDFQPPPKQAHRYATQIAA